MIDLLTQSINKISQIDQKIAQIDKKEPEKKFVDSMRSMIDSLTQSINKIAQIGKQEAKNKFVDNMRSMIVSLSKTDNKISQATLIKKFPNTCQLSNKDFNKFPLLLRKCVYRYEYMNSREKFNETSLPNKEYFYSKINKEHITDEDYAHAQKVWNTFKIKNSGKYHDLYMFNLIKILEINV